MNFYLVLSVVGLLHITKACLPPGGGLFSPAYSYNSVPQQYYGDSMYYPHPRAQYRSQQAAADIVSGDKDLNLNCPSFAKSCKWSNINTDQLDWNVLSASEEGLRQMSSLKNFGSAPDPEAAVVVATNVAKNGWEAAQLVSDPIPCMKQPLTITISAWRSTQESAFEQPQLQVCAKNSNSKYEATNCSPFNFKNGIAASVQVTPPEEPTSPVQLVIIANNLLGSAGSSIFIQDINVDGIQDCLDNAIEEEFSTNNIDSSSAGINKPVQTFDMNSMSKKSIPSANDKNFLDNLCSALSCNPAESADCKWYAKGANSWEKGQTSRRSNPLTGVQLSPVEGEKFLVASFTSRKMTNYILTSDTITIPENAGQQLYYCFYEFINTVGSKISLCQDSQGQRCFYESNNPSANDLVKRNREWGYKCVELPIGTYEVNLIGTNGGENLGDIGFAASKISTDAEGLQNISQYYYPSPVVESAPVPSIILPTYESAQASYAVPQSAYSIPSVAASYPTLEDSNAVPQSSFSLPSAAASYPTLEDSNAVPQSSFSLPSAAASYPILETSYGIPSKTNAYVEIPNYLPSKSASYAEVPSNSASYAEVPSYVGSKSDSYAEVPSYVGSKGDSYAEVPSYVGSKSDVEMPTNYISSRTNSYPDVHNYVPSKPDYRPMPPAYNPPNPSPNIANSYRVSSAINNEIPPSAIKSTDFENKPQYQPASNLIISKPEIFPTLNLPVKEISLKFDPESQTNNEVFPSVMTDLAEAAEIIPMTNSGKKKGLSPPMSARFKSEEVALYDLACTKIDTCKWFNEDTNSYEWKFIDIKSTESKSTIPEQFHKNEFSFLQLSATKSGATRNSALLISKSINCQKNSAHIAFKAYINDKKILSELIHLEICIRHLSPVDVERCKRVYPDMNYDVYHKIDSVDKAFNIIIRTFVFDTFLQGTIAAVRDIRYEVPEGTILDSCDNDEEQQSPDAGITPVDKSVAKKMSTFLTDGGTSDDYDEFETNAIKDTKGLNMLKKPAKTQIANAVKILDESKMSCDAIVCSPERLLKETNCLYNNFIITPELEETLESGWSVVTVADKLKNTLSKPKTLDDSDLLDGTNNLFLTANFYGMDSPMYIFESPIINLNSSTTFYITFQRHIAIDGVQLMVCGDKYGNNCIYDSKSKNKQRDWVIEHALIKPNMSQIVFLARGTNQITSKTVGQIGLFDIQLYKYEKNALILFC
uniref:MAM domain-containing protein n=1 Tax=Rhabditophanes sp. KR3021 TaxID=114890 RepID=A0AC35U7M5_9BILA